MRRKCAIAVQALLEAMDFSGSLAGRRQRPSHAKVRSMTYRLGMTSKPLALSERLTISSDRFPILSKAPRSFGPA